MLRNRDMQLKHIFIFQSKLCPLSLKKVICGIMILILVTSAWVGATQFLKATYQAEEVGDNVTDFAFRYFYHCRDIVVRSTVNWL
jgi:4-amino-4-deoxy-L-arabinose transferase-like glycosyltransferase